jgi:hypothetical protein
MKIQADILGVPVVRPAVAETTALGAAYAAGLATGFWRDTSELRANWHESTRWHPSWTDAQRSAGYAGWRKAVDRTLNWLDIDQQSRSLSRTTRRASPRPPARHLVASLRAPPATWWRPCAPRPPRGAPCLFPPVPQAP